MTAKKAGKVTITAKYKTYTATKTITIEEAVKSASVSGPSTLVAGGKTGTYKLTVTFRSGKKKVVSCDWEIPAHHRYNAEINNKGVLTPLAPCSLKVIAGYGGKDFVKKVIIEEPKLKSVSISGAATVKVGAKSSYTLIGHMNTGKTTKSLPRTPTWKSSNTKVATIDKNGNLVAKKAGTVTITGTCKNLKATKKVTIKK